MQNNNKNNSYWDIQWKSAFNILGGLPGGSFVKNLPARHGFYPWSRKIPTFHGTTKPVPYNCAHTPKAWEPQLLKSKCSRACAHNKKSHCNEKLAYKN